jgi:Domain of unknown function (DUF5615)
MRTLASELRAMTHDVTSMPRVYADANVPAGVVSAMRHELGWDVLFVLEHDDLRRASDARHFSRAIDLGRILVTQDRDFLDPGRFPPDLAPGVIVCVASDERTLLRLLRYADRRLLRPSTGQPLAGRTVVLTVDVLQAEG